MSTTAFPCRKDTTFKRIIRISLTFDYKYSQSEIKCEKTFVMLSAYFLRNPHSIMTNCKFVIGNEEKHLGCAHVDVHEILHVRSLR